MGVSEIGRRFVEKCGTWSSVREAPRTRRIRQSRIKVGHFWGGGRGSAMTNTVRQTPGGLLILHLDNVVVVVVVWCGGFMCV